ATFPVFILELQRYLNSTESDPSQIVGTPRDLEVDGTRYEPKMTCSFWAEKRESGAAKPAEAKAPGEEAKPDEKEAAEETGAKDLGEETGTESGNRLTFLFNKTQKPGVYFLKLTLRTEPGAPVKTETRAYAFNVDTLNESDLQRAGTEQLEKVATANKITNPEAIVE